MTSGVLGVDTIAARTLIRLRNEFPQIQLVLVLPCPLEQQTIKWTQKQKNEYHNILEQADKVKILSEQYTDSCMLDRNKYMVDNSSKLIYYLRATRGGTRFTVKYVQSQSIDLMEL